MANRLVSVDEGYLFPTPLEARLTAKMTASVTDTAVAAQINGTQTGPAIDHRVGIQIAPVVDQLVAEAIADDQTLVDAAAAAVDANPTIASLTTKVETAATVTSNAPFYRRGTLDISIALNSLNKASDTGFYTISSSNANLNLPSTPGVAGELLVISTGNATKQILTWRSNGGAYEREATASTWSAWRRTDRGNEEIRSKVLSMEPALVGLQDIAIGAFYEKETLADGTDLNSLKTRSSNGIHLIGSTQDYSNRPVGKGEPGVRVPGMLLNFSTGIQDTYQMVIYRNRGGVFERYQTGADSFSEWVEPGTGGSGGGTELENLKNRVELLEMTAPAITPFEVNNVFTTYGAGDAYMDLLAAKFATKLSILDLGDSREGLPIRAFQMGDPTKPTYYIMAAQHGSEPMGREAALIWVRELCEDDTPETATFLQNYCVVVTPCVNVDRINVQRLSSSNTDLNRNWITQTTAEIQAASSVFSTHNVVLTLDAHEGGKWTAMQAGIVSAPEAAQSLKDVSQGLYDAVAADFVAASENFETYPGDDVLEIARNAVAVQYKSASIVFEGASGLDADMYSPDVVWRRSVYLLVYRSVFDYLKTNMNDFIAAKAAAEV